MSAEVIQIIMSVLGTLGFAILFNIRGKRLVAASLGGFFAWFIFFLLGNVITNEAVRYFIVSFLISFYAEAIARILKTPTTTVLMTALVPLIPGASLYYTMAYAWGSDIEKFIKKATATLQLSGALALGIVMATMIMHVFYVINVKRNKKEKTDGND